MTAPKSTGKITVTKIQAPANDGVSKMEQNMTADQEALLLLMAEGIATWSPRAKEIEALIKKIERARDRPDEAR